MSDRYRAPFAPGQELAVDPALAQRVLNAALDSGGDYADLYFEYRASGGLGYEEGTLKSASRGVTLGLGVRVLEGDATGYAYTEALEPEAMVAAARTASQIAKGGSSQSVDEPKFASLPRRHQDVSSLVSGDGETKRHMLRRADQAARAFDSRITHVQVSMAEEHKEILIATSDGLFVYDRQPMLRFGVHVVAEEGALRQSGSSGGGGRTDLSYFLMNGQRPEDHGREAARVAIAMLHAVDAPAGELPVVLAAGDSGILLHEAVGHGLEADFNRKRTSNYTDQVGHLVASSLVSVVDDPTLPNGRGTINRDDEGRVAEPVNLIENGVLQGYMQDRQSAKHFKVDSNSGRRQSFRHIPMPRMTNTLMLGGPHSPEEIIESVKRGVYAKKFSGGQVNISNGDFVFSLTESYLIEDGKITAPLKGVNLIGNGPEVLKQVDLLAADLTVSDGIWTCGKEGQSVPVGVGCPTMRIKSMTVGGTKVG